MNQPFPRADRVMAIVTALSHGATMYMNDAHAHSSFGDRPGYEYARIRGEFCRQLGMKLAGWMNDNPHADVLLSDAIELFIDDWKPTKAIPDSTATEPLNIYPPKKRKAKKRGKR